MRSKPHVHPIPSPNLFPFNAIHHLLFLIGILTFFFFFTWNFKPKNCFYLSTQKWYVTSCKLIIIIIHIHIHPCCCFKINPAHPFKKKHMHTKNIVHTILTNCKLCRPVDQTRIESQQCLQWKMTILLLMANIG